MPRQPSRVFALASRLTDPHLEIEPIDLEAEPSPPSRETPAEVGRRLADASFPLAHRVNHRKLEAIIRKKISRRVRLPRARASMRIKFQVDLAPLGGVTKMCEDAGLTLEEGPRRKGRRILRTWKTAGPKATALFRQLNKAHPLGWGGGKLVAPGKDSVKKVVRVMTLLAPPLTVEHFINQDEETATITAYLVTYNEEGRLGLPPNHKEIWGPWAAATEMQLKKYAKKMLGDMFVEQMAISQTFLKNLGPQYASSESEMSESEMSEAEE